MCVSVSLRVRNVSITFILHYATVFRIPSSLRVRWIFTFNREKKTAKLESETILFYWHIPHTVPAKSELHFDILTYEVISTDVPNKLWNKKCNENIKRNKVLAARYYDFCSDFLRHIHILINQKISCWLETCKGIWFKRNAWWFYLLLCVGKKRKVCAELEATRVSVFCFLSCSAYIHNNSLLIKHT